MGVERRGRAICGLSVRSTRALVLEGAVLSELKSSGKPFEISKRLVWEAYLRVKANKGAAGVDRQSIEDFETDLRNNLFKLWNRSVSRTRRAE
jgi:hypothetical protein